MRYSIERKGKNLSLRIEVLNGHYNDLFNDELKLETTNGHNMVKIRVRIV